MERHILLAYVLHFISFLMEDVSIAKKLEKIILFGSVARDDFDEESDIDVFVETDEKYESLILGRLRVFRETERWKLIGIKNDIKLYIGHLKNYPDLRRSIISDGIYLYGKYQEKPKDLSQYVLFSISLEKLNRLEKIKLWRELYGYVQKIGRKTYRSEGIIKKIGGRKIGRGVFLIPAEYSQKIIGLLKPRRISYEIIEIWTDFNFR